MWYRYDNLAWQSRWLAYSSSLADQGVPSRRRAAILLGSAAAVLGTDGPLGSGSHKLSRNTPQPQKEVPPGLCKQKTPVAKLVLGQMSRERSRRQCDNCLGLCPQPITFQSKLSSFSKDSWFPPWIMKKIKTISTSYVLTKIKGRKVIWEQHGTIQRRV